MCPVTAPSRASQRDGAQRDGDGAAVAAPAAELGLPVGGAGHRRGEFVLDARPILGIDRRGEAVARQLLGGQAEQLLHAWIGVDAAAGGVGDEDAGGKGVAERLDRRHAAQRAGERALEGRRLSCGPTSREVYPGVSARSMDGGDRRNRRVAQPMAVFVLQTGRA